MPLRWSKAEHQNYSFGERMDLRDEWITASDDRIDCDPALSKEAAIGRQIHRLPALASKFYNHEEECYGWKPKLCAILAGTQDENSPMSALSGFEETILRNIYSFLADRFAKHVTLTIPACCVGQIEHAGIARFNNGRSPTQCKSREIMDKSVLSPTSCLVTSGEGQPTGGYVAFAICGEIEFPNAADRNVNMLPFIFGDKSSLPAELQCYFDCIERCPYPEEEIGKVGYLTVHESFVEAGASQRREGLHIETPGLFGEKGSGAFTAAFEHSWGGGVFFGPDMYDGGIYMASSVSDTSEVWDALVHKKVRGITDRHGGCEHLRRLIGPGTKIKANKLVWMTDCTPHQALPQENPGYRQFFRVVTSQISHWFAAHSTQNPLVPLPDYVQIVEENKFT